MLRSMLFKTSLKLLHWILQYFELLKKLLSLFLKVESSSMLDSLRRYARLWSWTFDLYKPARHVYWEVCFIKATDPLTMNSCKVFPDQQSKDPEVSASFSVMSHSLESIMYKSLSSLDSCPVSSLAHSNLRMAPAHSTNPSSFHTLCGLRPSGIACMLWGICKQFTGRCEKARCCQSWACECW